MSAEIQHVPAPWTLKGTVYALAWLQAKDTEATPFPAGLAYSPLEAASDFAGPAFGRPVGGLALIQLIRYSDSPVGAYDELLIMPGYFAYPAADDGSEGRRVERSACRVTRIYVSQKYTCWNGRHNWNVPKHLAKFEWTDGPDGSVHCKVFPHDTAGDAAEARPSAEPFFQASFKPVPYVPAFPASTSVLKYVGMDVRMVQPPVPRGPAASQGELAGTDRWCRALPVIRGSASLGWFDMAQRDESGARAGEYEHFWPGFSRWILGARIDNATIEVLDAEHWDTPRSVL